MKLPALALSMALAGPLCAGGDAPPPAADPYLWLEEVVGERPMAWVRSRNAETAAAFEEGPAFKGLESDLLRIMDSPAKIPYVGKHGDFYYNLWQDAANPRGLWRRTTLAEYRKAEPRWEVLLDLDALGKEEKESWVFKGATYLRPGNRRCLVSLSRGGSDAVVVREFDLGTKAFVKEGFQLPEAKSSVAWIDADTLFVGTEFGPGSMTRSGYPRLAKVWKRGTPLSEARTVFEGKEGDVSVFAFHDSTPGFERSFVGRNPTFFTSELHLLGKEGRLTKVDVPEDASASVHREWMLVQLRTPWKVGGRDFAAGSLLATRFEDFLGGGRDFQVLFEPTPATTGSVASCDVLDTAGVGTQASYHISTWRVRGPSNSAAAPGNGNGWNRSADQRPQGAQFPTSPRK